MTEHFDGHQPRQCGEHRTLGPHRAWCYDCREYCYPRLEAACQGCIAASPGLVPHCPTCTCGCTCGYGGQHEPEKETCELNRRQAVFDAARAEHAETLRMLADDD